ncbi:MAG: hypothetical protein NTX65_00135 [Ignavibacteriales bacterium]|nr:hypothetical protein [Ignavibacteriales bacterium]
MILNPIDKSNYLRGLLILIKRDRTINEIEKERIKELSKVLGFNGRFVENAVNELLDNEYLTENPPKFTNHILAEAFIKDALKIAFIDNVLNIYKLNWLSSFAIDNDLSKQWLFMELEQFIDNADRHITDRFEIQNYLNSEFAAA